MPLKQIGKDCGSGIIVVDGIEHPVSYTLDVQQQVERDGTRGLVSALGTLSGTGSSLYAAYNSRSPVTLRLDNGDEISILISTMDGPSGPAQYEVVGEIPGY